MKLASAMSILENRGDKFSEGRVGLRIKGGRSLEHVSICAMFPARPRAGSSICASFWRNVFRRRRCCQPIGLSPGLRTLCSAGGWPNAGRHYRINQRLRKRRQRVDHRRTFAPRLRRRYFLRAHRWTRFVRSAIHRWRCVAAFALGALPESGGSDTGGRSAFARREFSARHSRSCSPAQWKNCANFTDQVVSVATPRRTGADRVPRLTRHSMISSAQWKLTLENRWTLPQLDWEAADLQEQLQFRLQRAQPNKWRSEQKLARVS